ncbi:hypothetical protein [Sphingomonas sp. DT-204]|uniref:hypothetical protein n=1 Tax=Sphingomonas sp. DT-204 TaxID=3396166 RepID=UPI003F1CE019
MTVRGLLLLSIVWTAPAGAATTARVGQQPAAEQKCPTLPPMLAAERRCPKQPAMLVGEPAR